MTLTHVTLYSDLMQSFSHMALTYVRLYSDDLSVCMAEEFVFLCAPTMCLRGLFCQLSFSVKSLMRTRDVT
jgi:hypothetical protein